MAYKKYIKRGNKLCGPYYYESYRDSSGKVRKRYLGTKPSKKNVTPTSSFGKFKDFKWIIPLIFLILLFVGVFSFSITGWASLDVREVEDSLGFFTGFGEQEGLQESVKQGQAVLNRPVKWKTNIFLDEVADLRIILPENSENIIVLRVIGGQKQDITSGVEIRTRGLFRKHVDVEIRQDVDEYEIEYLTPAPEALEEKISESQKRVIIKSPDDVHYENILTFTEIPELLKKGEEKHLKLYEIKKQAGKEVRQEIKFAAYDTNENDFLDYVEWITPELSEAVFEVEILVLNVQSYPQIGDNWTVAFTTLGRADLRIAAAEETTWSNINENNDLKFLEIRCGEEILSYIWEEGSVLIEDYECNETGFEVSKALTSGKHVLEFSFGGKTAFAYNEAGRSTIFYEGFESGDFSCGNCQGANNNELLGWSTWSDRGGNEIAEIMSEGCTSLCDGIYYMQMSGGDGTAGGTACDGSEYCTGVSHIVNTTGYRNINVSWVFSDTSNNYEAPDEQLALQFSCDGGSTWITAIDINPVSGFSQFYNEDLSVIDSCVEDNSNVQIRVWQDPNHWNEYIFTDEINVSGELINWYPSIPSNIQCNYDGCDILVDSFVVLNASGSVDPEGDAITYFIEASLKNITLTDDLELGEIQKTVLSGGIIWDSLTYDNFDSGSWGGWVDGGTDSLMSTTRHYCGNTVHSVNLQDDTTTSYTELAAGLNLATPGYTNLSIDFWAYYESIEAGECLDILCEGSVVWSYCPNEEATEDQWLHQTLNLENGVDCVFDASTIIRFEAEFSHNNDDVWLDCINLTATIGEIQTISDGNVTSTTYEDVNGDYGEIINVTVKVEVSSYNPEASVQQSTYDPDLFLEIYNGSDWVEIGKFNLNETYTSDSLNITSYNFSLTTSGLDILGAWQTSISQDIRVKGVDMDFYNETRIDEINYTGVWVIINGIKWIEIGNHSETEIFNWNTTDIPEQSCIDLRARVSDLFASGEFSGYFLKDACLNISHSLAISVSMSSKLFQQINWTLDYLPVTGEPADGNNDEGPTGYFINISVEQGNVDLYMKASGDLMTQGLDVLSLENEMYSYNLTNSSVPSGTKTSLTTSFSNHQIGDNLGDGRVVYLKFFLSAPPAQPAGTYNNTLLFKAVPNGQPP